MIKVGLAILLSGRTLCPVLSVFAAEKGLVAGDKIEVSTTLKPLTEAEMVAMTLEKSNKLKAMATSVEIAGYRLKSARNIPNPEIRLNDITEESYASEFDETRIGLRIRFPELGEMGEDRQDAMVRLWERKNEELLYRQELVAEARRDFFSVILHDQLKELAGKKVAIEENRLKVIEEMVRVGTRSIVYYTKAKMRHVDSINDYSREVQSQIEARRKLSKRTGVNINIPVMETDLPEVTVGIDRLIEIAFEKRPEIQLVRQRIGLASKENRRELMKLLPQLNFIQYNHHIETNSKADWGELALGVEVPLFNWNYGNIKAASLAVQKKEQELAAVEETVEYQVRAAFTEYEDLLLDWKNFIYESENLMAESARVIEQAKQHQTLLMDEVMEMEMTILETQAIIAQKKKDLADALLDLCITLGVEDYRLLQN